MMPGSISKIGGLGLQVRRGKTLLQKAISALKRNNAVLFYVPNNYAGAYTDNIGVDPVNNVSDVLGYISDRTGTNVTAIQSTGDNKPTVENVLGRNVIYFDLSNDTLTINMPNTGSPFVRTYTTTGTVPDAISSTVSSLVVGFPTLAGRNVCAIICSPNIITGVDLAVIERWVTSIGAKVSYPGEIGSTFVIGESALA